MSENSQPSVAMDDSVQSDAQWFDDPKKRFSDFALRDYELKIQYLTSHFQRMWTRFNYFVVIQAALIGGKTIFGNKAVSIAGFGLCLSLVWYVMGAEDRFLVQRYRDQVKEAAALLAGSLWPSTVQKYHFVGDPAGAGASFRSPRQGWLDFITAWRLEAISTTRLASLIPLTVSLVWLGLLVRVLVGPVQVK